MAATKLTHVRMGVFHRNSFPDHLNKGMDTFLERSAQIPVQGGQFFKREQATTLEHKLTTWGTALNTPRENEDTDPLPFEVTAPGYDQTITLATYRNAVRVTRTMLQIDVSGKIRSMMQGLPNSGIRFLELGFANVINTGSSTAGSDGSNLFASDHFQEDPAGGTWDNDETAAALTTTSFNTMRQNMRKRNDEKGMVGPITLKTLFGAADQEQKMRQITGSDKVPEDALNAINPWKGVNTMVWDYITDTNAFFGWGDLPEDMWGLHFIVLSDFSIMALPLPSAAYPDIVAGWRTRGQVAFSGSQLKNLHKNAGA